MAKKKSIFKSVSKAVSKAVSSVGKTAAVAVGVSSSTKSSSNEISDLKKKLANCNSTTTSLTTDKINLNNEITGLNDKITGLSSEISGLNNEIMGLNTEITGLKTNITGLTYNLGKEQTNNTYLNDQVYGDVNKLGSSQLVATKIGKEIAGFENKEPFVEGLEGDALVVNLEKVTKENELLEKQIQENSNKFTADDSKYFYKTEQYNFQFQVNRGLNFFYYILVTILAIVLGFYDRTINLYVKCGIVFVLLFYPYLIVYLEYLLYIASKYVYSILYNTPFDMQNDYWFMITNQ
jgi:regulator of replication initiation timing